MKGFETTIIVRHTQGTTNDYIKDLLSGEIEDMMITNIKVKQKKIEVTDNEYKKCFD